MEVNIRDEANPLALIHMVTESMKQAIQSVPEQYLGLDSTVYEAEIADHKLTQTDRRLRMAFWLEYERARRKGVTMSASRIWEPSCTDEHFYKAIKNPMKMGYYLIPPVSYSLACKDLLDRSIGVLGKILDEVARCKKIDSRMADIALKIFNQLDARVNGAVVQRVEQKNLNLNVDTNKMELTLEDVKKKLAELEHKGPEPKVIEVKAE